MITQLLFYKEKTNKWYVDLPDFPGSKAELEMIAGADAMLDIYAGDKTSIKINISLTQLPDYDELIFKKEDGSNTGAYYKFAKLKGANYNFQVWLCNVTKYVFGEFPKAIYLKTMN